MNVLGLRWVGIRSPEYEPMVRLLRDVMGLRVEFSEDTTTELSLPNGDRVQVFAPGDAYYEFLGKHAGGPVPLFEVDDLRAARAELLAAGVTQSVLSVMTRLGSGCTSERLTATCTNWRPVEVRPGSPVTAPSAHATVRTCLICREQCA